MKTGKTPYLLLAVLSLLMFHALGAVGGLSLGHLMEPSPGHAYVMLLWVLFGSIATFSVWKAGVSGGQANRLVIRFMAIPEKYFVAISMVAVFLFSSAIRFFVLQNTSVTDDEACYTFMSKLLMTGKLSAASHPARLFFDRVFMINDGAYYSQYFLGWPIMLMPDALFGWNGYINTVYAALTLPAVFQSGKLLFGQRWARIGALLYTASPLLLIGAATKLSHTAEIMCLSWMFLFFLKLRKTDRLGFHVAFISTFSVAFYIRPYSAISFGLPLLLWWLTYCVWKSNWIRIKNGLCAAVIGLFFLAGFFAVIHAQTGSALLTPYRSYINYTIENGCRFSRFPSVEVAESLKLLHLNPNHALTVISAFLIRMNTALFGWPCSFLFILFAPFGKKSAALWLIALSYSVFGMFVSDPGIDIYGPVHFSEITIPAIFLSVAGMKHLSLLQYTYLKPKKTPSRLLPLACCGALIISAWLGYIPVRLRAVHELAGEIGKPANLAKQLQTPSVVFVPRPYIKTLTQFKKGFVFFPPGNDPDLCNPVLWVNHLTMEDDQRFLELFFSDRQGYLLVWHNNEAYYVALNAFEHPEKVSDGQIGGTGEGIDWNETLKAVHHE